MRCEDARDLILERGKQDTLPAFDDHLTVCEQCQAMYQASVDMEQLAKSWQDEPAPNWERPVIIPRTSFWQSLFVWAPLAACLMMCVLILFRVELSVDDRGWRLRFGSSQQDLQFVEQQFQRRLDASLAREKEQNKNELKALLVSYDEHQNKNLDATTTQVTERMRAESDLNLQKVIDNWQDQRSKDLMWMDHRFETLVLRQQRNSNNLYKIANYVNSPAKSQL